MGLIGCVMHPLYVGAAAYLMSPLDFLQRPVRWLAAISRHGGTCGGGPNFCYELCLRRISEEERSGLDLSSWEVAFSGAEPVRARTIRRFTETFAGSGFAPSAWLPCYGLAEASLFVAGAPARHGARLLRVDRAELALGRAVPVPEHGTGAVEIVSSGVASPGDRVCIVGAGTARPVEPGGVGEIWVRGDGVASGYWNRDAETGETFGHRLEGETGSFLRTGDLGFVHAGELFVTGRSRELIIVRGRNVHPQDVEDAAQTADPRLRPGCGAAFALEAADEEVVVLVQETAVTDGQELERLLELVRERVLESQHVALAAVVLVGPRSVPKTSSGKLQRAACRQAFLAGEVALLAEWRSAAVPAPAAGAR